MKKKRRQDTLKYTPMKEGRKVKKWHISVKAMKEFNRNDVENSLAKQFGWRMPKIKYRPSSA